MVEYMPLGQSLSSPKISGKFLSQNSQVKVHSNEDAKDASEMRSLLNYNGIFAFGVGTSPDKLNYSYVDDIWNSYLVCIWLSFTRLMQN